MERLLLIITSFIFAYGVFAQTPIYYAERYDTTNFLNWSDGYDKNDLHGGNFDVRTTVAFFPSNKSYLDANPEFNYSGVLDISENPMISIELLQPKTFDFSVAFLAVDINGNIATTEEIKLPMNSDPKLYNLVFEKNDSIDFTQIDGVQLAKKRSLTNLSYTESNITDFYISAISIGKEIVEEDNINYETKVFNSSNWGLESPIIEGKKSISVQDGYLVLEQDSTNIPFDGDSDNDVNFRLFLGDTFNLQDHPFVGIKYKSNQDITFGINARDIVTMSYENNNLEMWSTYSRSIGPGYAGSSIDSENKYISDSSDCFSILNFDLHLDCEICGGMGNYEFFRIDSVNGLVMNVLSHDRTKPLRIEIEEIVIGGILEEDYVEPGVSNLFATGGFSGINYSFNFSGNLSFEQTLSEDSKMSIYLSENQYLGDDDTLLAIHNVDDQMFSFEELIEYETYREDLNDSFFSKGLETKIGDLRFHDASGHLIFKFYENSCFQPIITSESFHFDFVTGNKQKNISGINVFPNPTSDQLTIEREGVYIKEISIYNMSGVLLKSENSDNEIIDVSALDIGVYLLQLQTDNGLYNSQFVKE